MRYILIIAYVIAYVAATPIKNEENLKNIDLKSEGKASESILLDITEDTEETEVAEGREILQVVKTEKDGRKTIHIHSPNPPNINIMPTKYQIAANLPQSPFMPYTADRPMFYEQQVKPDMKKRKEESQPKNKVNVYIYFGQNNSMTEMEGTNAEMPEGIEKIENKTKKPMAVTMATKEVIQEAPVTKPNPVQGSSVTRHKTPTLILVCPKGHVKILGACVEYDQD